jgi:signal transduction histidine kinase
VPADTLRSLLAEPRAPDPPGPAPRDWALVGVCIAAATVETVLRTDLAWRPFALGLVAALALLLPWRRTHPLIVTALAFGSVSVVDAVMLFVDVEWEALGTGVFLLIVPYALTRWGSGREVATGLALLVLPVTITALNGEVIGDLIGGVVVLSLAAALGAGARYQQVSRQQEVHRIRSLERELLARELHDTVAHHVSAIAVRAQAGRAVSPTDPSAALDALVVIEEEASRTLEEMRSMVGALRDGERADLAPQHGIADLERLAAAAGDSPKVEVELSGDLDDLRPSIDAAVYRLAQEAITNAVRHARRASLVRVQICGEPDTIRLVVSDDGHGSPIAPVPGFGLVGMEERARLLGGTFEAGPASGSGSGTGSGQASRHGWTVSASLPRHGSAS